MSFVYPSVRAILAGAFLIALAPVPHALAGGPGFNRDIRPILSENCFLCHGPDPAHRGGDVRLDVREEAIAGHDGPAAIVPGDSAASAMIQRILSTDPLDVMPPPDAHLTPLRPEEIALLKDWIDHGAVYEAHWAFEPPLKPSLPAGVSTHPVDAFVRERLKQEGLVPAPPADPATLVRRAFLDLTGLPPAPRDIDAYLADPSPDRWGRLVDRLMESPHFAERMAIPWLDAARYSDTNGYSIDDHRDMWAWRDWVIHAFHHNMPYDRFLTEQLAGDLMPDATPDQIAATGFLRNGMNTHEGGIIPEEYRVAYTLDKVDVVGTAMLGLTMKCAQCHDHKYDPISQEEYFQFYAFFNTASEPGVGATNASTAPLMPYASPLGDGGMDGLRQRIAELEFLKLHPTAPVVEARTDWEIQQAAIEQEATGPAGDFPWHDVTPESVKWIWAGEPAADQAAQFRREVDLPAGVLEAWLFVTCDDQAEVRINGKAAASVTLWMEPALAEVTDHLTAGETTTILVDAKNRGGIAGFLAVLAWRDGDGWHVLASDPSWDARLGADPDWRPATAVADFNQPPWGDVTASFRKSGGALRAILATPPAQRDAAQWNALNAAFISSGEPLAGRMDAVLKSLEVEIQVLRRDLERGMSTVMVMDHQPDLRKTHILIRGAYDQPGDEVFAGVPAVLPPLAAGENPNRLDLARWITRPDHPLTARVAVNLVWQMIFGTGIVETAGDFGNQGSWPSHPELLDWLAVDFVANGWDLRHLIRTILSSETYRQSAVSTAEDLERDPRNLLLSRSPRSRLPAEIIRDQALAASGLLNPAVGGPGVHPLQPDGLWRDISHFGHPTVFTAQHFYPGLGPTQFRRSLYTFWKRTSPPPMLSLFDALMRETCSVIRGRTNTPLQALVLMNDPQFVQAGVALGRRMIDEGGDAVADRLAHGFRLATGRHPAPQERALLENAFTRHHRRYAADPAAARELTDAGLPDADDAAAAELAAFAMVGATLINLDEAINRP
jgi:hypothetical protein